MRVRACINRRQNDTNILLYYKHEFFDQTHTVDYTKPQSHTHSVIFLLLRGVPVVQKYIFSTTKLSYSKKFPLFPV